MSRSSWKRGCLGSGVGEVLTLATPASDRRRVVAWGQRTHFQRPVSGRLWSSVRRGMCTCTGAAGWAAGLALCSGCRQHVWVVVEVCQRTVERSNSQCLRPRGTPGLQVRRATRRLMRAFPAMPAMAGGMGALCLRGLARVGAAKPCALWGNEGAAGRGPGALGCRLAPGGLWRRGGGAGPSWAGRACSGLRRPRARRSAVKNA